MVFRLIILREKLHSVGLNSQYMCLLNNIISEFSCDKGLL